MTIDIDQVTEDLKRHEGFRSEVYQDHLGFWTIGYGRMVDRRRFGGITKDEAEMLLQNDVAKVFNQLNTSLPAFNKYPERVKRALVNMAFQMGIGGVLRFRKMIAALNAGNYKQAAKEALDSTWAKQTPRRAREVASWLSGEV